MTTAQLKHSTDRRFDRLDRSLNRKFEKIDQRFDKIDRRFDEVDRRFEEIGRQFEEIGRQFEESRRHSNIIAESLRDDLRLFADASATHSERLDQHETRIGRLEGRLPKA